MMDVWKMESLFKRHREAEAAREYDTVMGTFADDCYLETVALCTRREGRDAVRAGYVAYFTAFPDLTPDDENVAFGDDVMVAWGQLRGTSRGEWLGVAPGGGAFVVPFTNVATFAGDPDAGREHLLRSRHALRPGEVAHRRHQDGCELGHISTVDMTTRPTCTRS